VRFNRADREVFGVGTLVFALLAMMFAFIALVTAGQAYSRSNDTNARVTKLESGGLLGNSAKVTLEEFTITLTNTGKLGASVLVREHMYRGETWGLAYSSVPLTIAWFDSQLAHCHNSTIGNAIA